MEFSNYKKLIVWRKSYGLSLKIYDITKGFPKTEVFGLTSQIRRCAVSIPSNIAEGAGRLSKKEFINFLSIARGSCNELETQLSISKDLGFIKEVDFENLQKDCTEILKMMSKLINNLKSNI